MPLPRPPHIDPRIPDSALEDRGGRLELKDIISRRHVRKMNALRKLGITPPANDAENYLRLKESHGY